MTDMRNTQDLVITLDSGAPSLQVTQDLLIVLSAANPLVAPPITGAAPLGIKENLCGPTILRLRWCK